MNLKIKLNKEQFYETLYIGCKLFKPLNGFMCFEDYKSVVDDMILKNNKVWTIPVTLDVEYEFFLKSKKANFASLVFENKEVALLEIKDSFIVEKEDIKKIFKTDDIAHPGVKKNSQDINIELGER